MNKLPLRLHASTALFSEAQLAEGTVPLSCVPVMAIEVSAVSELTSGKVPASGVLATSMLRRLAGRVPGSAVKPALFTDSRSRDGGTGTVPVSADNESSCMLVRLGRIHADGELTAVMLRRLRRWSAGSEDRALSEPLKQLGARLQMMLSESRDDQPDMPLGSAPGLPLDDIGS